MKYFASLCALALAGAMPGFAVSAHSTTVNPQNQFHFKPTGRRGTLSSGKATFQTLSLAAGVHSITIAYGGDSSFNASASSAYSQTVDNPGTATGSYTVHVSGTGTAGTNGVGSPNQSIGLTLVVK